MPIPAFDGQRVVVIGGTSGIGYAVAEAAVAEGAVVVVASREQAKIDAAVRQLGTAATGTVVDVSNEASIEALFNATGAFNHLVFTAGEQGLGSRPGFACADGFGCSSRGAGRQVLGRAEGDQARAGASFAGGFRHAHGRGAGADADEGLPDGGKPWAAPCRAWSAAWRWTWRPSGSTQSARGWC